MKTIRGLIVLSLALSMPAMAAQAFELEHSKGLLQLDATPGQLATYDLAILDSLEALGIPVAGVPKSVYQGELAKYGSAPVIGTLFEPDYDALERLEPELIFAGRRSLPAIPKLQALAPTVAYNATGRPFMEDFRRDNLALARAFGKEDLAERAIEAVEKNVAALQQANQGKTAAFLFVINDNVIAHAPGDRFGYAYELTGLESVLPAKEASNAPAAPRPAPGSPEYRAAQAERARIITRVAQSDPDWLIILDRGAINNGEKTAARTLAAHPELSRTRAFEAGRVYYADPNGWYVMTGGLNNLKHITDDLLAHMK
ncbi:ABC transporter substrate-binding protein [Castellaniella sp.]|uniref:ABC transporter substrate-binding protein n=1 Tax=Castellaniella sp. TaxID=1955812 RepID=UPI0035659724